MFLVHKNKTSGKRVTGKTGSQVRILFSPLHISKPAEYQRVSFFSPLEVPF